VSTSTGVLSGSPPEQSRVRPESVFALALAFVLGLAALLALPQVRGEIVIAVTIATTVSGLALWLAALWLRQRHDGRALRISFVAVKAHYVQACCQCALYVYWGWFWRPVYEHVPLIVAQLLLVYSMDMLVCLTRRRSWTLGFGPFPIILSTNLFLLFKPDWFYLQFAMVALGVLGKEFFRWNREGRSIHVFNPSALGLFVFSIGLLATGTTDLTWGEEIATTLNRPPHIYLYIFLLGLIVQALFSVTLVTLWAALALICLNLLYTQVTGVYYFFDSNIPIAVFLGLHLLVTDPATSPTTNVGKVLFGAGYGIAVFGAYGLLELWGLPRFYDKLLCVPLLNLLVPVFDGITRQVNKKIVWAQKLHTGNRSHMAVWMIVFSGILATGFVGKGHPGNDAGFWETACADGLRNACQNLIQLHTDDCANGSAADCLRAGQLLGRGTPFPDDPRLEGSMLARACDLGLSAACDQFAIFVAAGGEQIFLRDCDEGDGLSCYLLGTVLMHGIAREPAPETAMEHWEQACQMGWARACGELGEAWLFGTVGQVELSETVPMFEVACDSGYLPSCANLGLLYLRGRGVAQDEARGRELLQQSCAGELLAACEMLEK